MERSNFVDQIKIFARSGHGGAGSKHFMRNKLTAMGGPDGGDGGRGAHIILKGNTQLWTLLHLRYYKNVLAENGENGSKNNSTGKFGKDIIIEVPLGTVARDEETGRVDAEILEDGQEVIWLQGGRGGLGNSNFATPTNQAPEHHQPGEEGVEGWKIIELKVLADVGLVGFPNAGKSTLLSVITAAKPKIANYAFTTLVPQLGMVEYRDGKSFCVADIPGIIEGAAEGKGLGHQFLRHIERARVLLVLLDTAMVDETPPEEQERVLLAELEKYRPELLERRRVTIWSRGDLAAGVEPPDGTLLVSGVTGLGVPQLLGRLATEVAAARAEVPVL